MWHQACHPCHLTHPQTVFFNKYLKMELRFLFFLKLAYEILLAHMIQEQFTNYLCCCPFCNLFLYFHYAESNYYYSHTSWFLSLPKLLSLLSAMRPKMNIIPRAKICAVSCTRLSSEGTHAWLMLCCHWLKTLKNCF